MAGQYESKENGDGSKKEVGAARRFLAGVVLPHQLVETMISTDKYRAPLFVSYAAVCGVLRLFWPFNTTARQSLTTDRSAATYYFAGA